ncbi:flagellar assembly peptidoglycan hydrolase FlgJ [Noviherbaspirillum sp. CPCC 100848]|uniref:Peptidoglycan hydrolase FlgJ n=1 Tax=Noviherbaspirillum album TaxID=3080276 RepID=A0ABU6JCJ8_9BURK|nr:flagellar assembly peptidoglycan hydrolase FlgJ [Noviherbaspirillum sp. CPCC 100848]MEC4721367.1 flagellar assembly peptidoglycan hydrolase FlgJ [Noviherbaspirillum sp. CPCC 100848]
MVNRIDTSNNFAADIKDIGKLRQAAKQNSPEALTATAKQFEALFMNMVLKSMREATPQEGLFDSQQSKMYTSMFDQQLSQTMASRGVGLADVLTRQLSTVVDAQKDGKDGLKPGSPAEAAGFSRQDLNTALGVMQIAPPAEAARTSSNKPAHVRAFQDKLGAAAEDASRATGIPAKFMLGQAALESGWGRREIKGADGTNSFNVFGIKATGGWTGKVVETATTEYVNGVPRTRVEKFRAYDSYADAFKDYARLLTNNPRYEAVIANAKDITGFAQGLQKAGYATDPHYAAKLTRIIKQSLSV